MKRMSGSSANAASSSTTVGEKEKKDYSHNTMRPIDSAFRQQRIQSWNPYLDPVWCIVTFIVIGIIFVPVGFYINKLSEDVVELIVTYDSFDPNKIGANASSCSIERANEDKDCQVTFTIPKTMKPPVLLHYSIDNFHQNHRDFFFGKDSYQLLGQDMSSRQLLPQANDCDPLNKVKRNNTLTGETQEVWLNPCGLAANTLFNDIITLSDPDYELVEQGIAWESDMTWKFKQPHRYRDGLCNLPLLGDGSCDPNCCNDEILPDNETISWTCYQNADGTKEAYYDPITKQCYKFFYPDENTTQYLYETYPKVVPPIEGVLNEHFIVWMRLAVLPNFRKLYGYIEKEIPAGTELTFDINNNWIVTSFNGTKSLILSTNNIFGSKNDYLGYFFYSVGFFCIGIGVAFALKQFIRPRKVADKKYLRFKED